MQTVGATVQTERFRHAKNLGVVAVGADHEYGANHQLYGD
jgi:hypothetical protein